ncbi:MAG: hypothetical protein C0601_08675 [Candidatus Muiribacterium halophilum]|uniref:Uncharacterized protein n=1 Tax=Muiribacterium halophilum TaxID=2053465 RepID=A0A2N5ZE83_MUIH1|nr:MAG: hypothetical protein C0601_08675 [Candidatus Muirbacterium halophilum]
MRSLKVAFYSEVYESLAFERFMSILDKNKIENRLFFNPCLFNDFYINIPGLSKFFSSDIDTYIEEIRAYDPDYLCITIYTDFLYQTMDFLKRLKKAVPNIRIIAGGPHVTLEGKRFVEENIVIDFGVRGAGEMAIDGLFSGKSHAKIHGLIYREENLVFENDWSVLPHEEYADVPEKKEPYLRAMPYRRPYLITTTGFGCYFSCSFCYHSAMRNMGKKYGVVRKSITFLKKELLKAKKNGVKKIMFFDEEFLADKEFSKEFLPMYAKDIKIPFMCISHPFYINEEITILLKKANCINVELGTQVMDEHIRKTHLNRHEKDKDVLNAFTILGKYKLPVTINHMFGLPEETEEIHRKSLEIYTKYGIKRMLFFYLTAYPSISINRTLLEKKMIDEQKLEDVRLGSVDNMHLQGSTSKDNIYKRMEIFGEWIPFLPEKLALSLLRKRFYRFVPLSSILSYSAHVLSTFLFSPEYSIELHMKRYFYFIGKILIKKIKRKIS